MADSSRNVAKVRVASSSLVIRSIRNAWSERVFAVLGGRASGRRLPIKLPINLLGCGADGGGVTGSLRQRGTSSWELRVYAGTDAASSRVGSESTMTELLERWFETASASWSPSTVRQTRSVLRRQLIPHLGDVRVGELTPASIDELYGRLRAGGGVDGRPLAPGTVKRVHVVLHSALAQAVRWGWAWDNPADAPTALLPPPANPDPRPPRPSPRCWPMSKRPIPTSMRCW